MSFSRESPCLIVNGIERVLPAEDGRIQRLFLGFSGLFPRLCFLVGGGVFPVLPGSLWGAPSHPCPQFSPGRGDTSELRGLAAAAAAWTGDIPATAPAWHFLLLVRGPELGFACAGALSSTEGKSFPWDVPRRREVLVLCRS